MTPAEVQAELRTIAEELLAIEDRLRGLLEGLPRSPREDEMLEGRVAWDLATVLRVDLECVVGEQLRWVIEPLLRAAPGADDGVARKAASKRC